MSELFGRIILERKNQWINRLKGYKVEINGAEEDKKINNGSSEEYETPCGTNVVVCKVNWCSSNSLSFDIKPGETIYLKVVSGIKYFWVVYGFLMLALLGRTLFKKQMTPQLNVVMVSVSIVVMLYFLYYLTIGRKQYLKIEKDTNNIFAK